MRDLKLVDNNTKNTLDLTQYFPVEILQHILIKLPIKDILSFAKTSKDAHYIVNDDTFWNALIDRDFSDFDKKFFLNSIELASNYEKYKYLHTQKRQTLKKYRSKFDELANNNLSEKNACLAIMLAFYPNAKDDIVYYKSKGATEIEAQNLINNANSDEPNLCNYLNYFNALLHICFDIKNNKINREIDNYKHTHLMIVAHLGFEEHVKALLRVGADLFAEDPDRLTVVLYCNDNYGIFKILVQAIIKMGKVNCPLEIDGTTALMCAVKYGLLDEVNSLLAAGADVFAKNSGKYSAFCYNNNPEIAKALVQSIIKTGNLEQRLDNEDNTALMLTISFGLYDETKDLLSAGASIPYSNNELYYRIIQNAKNNKAIFKIIARKVIIDGKEITPVTSNGWNLETVALQIMSIKEWNELIQDIREKDTPDNPPLPLLNAYSDSRNSEPDNCNKTLSRRPVNGCPYNTRIFK